jgi:hypothetical protein
MTSFADTTDSINTATETQYIDTPQSTETVTINEYDLYKSLKSKNPKELRGYSPQTIQAIKNIDPKREIQKRAQYDDITLQGMGYSKSEISILRNFKGTEYEIRALSSTFTYNSSISYFFYSKSNDETSLGMNASWRWTKDPWFMGNDMLAFAWSEGFYIEENDSWCYADYDERRTNSSGYYVYTVDTRSIPLQLDSPTGACSFTIPLRDDSDSSTVSITRKGQAFIKATKFGKVRQASMISKYAHNQIGASLGLQYSTVPLTLGFSGSYSEVGKYYKRVDNPQVRY